MNVLFRSKDFRIVRWQKRVTARLQQALQYLQRLLSVDRPAGALVPIPVRVAHSNDLRRRRPRGWCD